jgi:hypothetical protein
MLIIENDNYKDSNSYYNVDLANIIDILNATIKNANRPEYTFDLRNFESNIQINKYKKKSEYLIQNSLIPEDELKNDDNLNTLLLRNLEDNKIYLYNILLSLKQYINNETNIQVITKLFPDNNPDNNLENLISYYKFYIRLIINFFIKNNKLYILVYDNKFVLKQIIEGSHEKTIYMYDSIYDNIYNGDYYLFKTKNEEYILINKRIIQEKHFDIIIKNINDYSSKSSIIFVFNSLNFANILLNSNLSDNSNNIGEYNTKNIEQIYHKLGYIDKLYSILYTSNKLKVNGGNKKKYEIHNNKKNNEAYIKYNKKKYYFYKNNKKIFIEINNKIIYLSKKSLNYDKNLNTYFINI